MTRRCIACLQPSRSYICRDCIRADRHAFDRQHAGIHPDEWVRRLNAWNGDLDARIAAIRAERASEMGAVA